MLQHDATPSMQEGTVSEPIQQQSVSQEPNVAETKVPAEGAHSYQTRDSTQEIAEAKPGTKLSQGLLYLTLKDTDSND